MEKEITKEDLILNELKHINETQNEIKENQERFEDSVDKRFDNLKTNDLAHIEEELNELDKDLRGVKSQMSIIIPIIVVLLALIFVILQINKT